MKGLAPKNKKAFAFGSYGWGGQSAGLVNDGLEACKFQIVMEPVKVQYIIVNEAGASVYSASKLATEEFPNFDVGQRSATSMARRLQDPLAELVKIDPKSIGVGQYQHDMNQKSSQRHSEEL